MFDTIFINLIEGFKIILQVKYLMYALFGSLLGTIVGVLPGIGSAGALAMMLPIILVLDPLGSVFMLAATYTGVMYGGSTASILLRVPGDTSAVIACLDGHEMAKQGNAGAALCIAAIGSYIAGTIAVVGLMILGPFVADLALKFSAPEYLALYIFAVTAVCSLVGNSMVKALLAMVFGLMISTIGEDFMGVKRFTMGVTELWDGIQFLSVTLGLFAISEVIINAENILSNEKREVLKHRVFIKLKEIIYSFWSIIRGGFIGFIIGVLPGAGAGIASFVSYSTERQISKNPENFGKGEIKGVAGPESANNAASAGAFVPMLALGVPGSATTAVMLGAFLMLDIQAGPMLFLERPDVVWGLVAALYVGNIFLLILNLPLISLFVRILYIPMAILLPIITVICMLGIYSSDQLTLSLYLMCMFGIIGYFMRLNDYPLAPVILGVVLGTRMEESFRQTMIMNQGNFFQILDRPIVLIFFGLAIISILIPVMFNKIKLDASDVD